MRRRGQAASTSPRSGGTQASRRVAGPTARRSGRQLGLGRRAAARAAGGARGAECGALPGGRDAKHDGIRQDLGVCVVRVEASGVIVSTALKRVGCWLVSTVASVVMA